MCWPLGQNDDCTLHRHQTHCSALQKESFFRCIKKNKTISRPQFIRLIHSCTHFLYNIERVVLHSYFFFYPTTSSYTCKCATQANFLCVHFHYEEFSSASSIHSTTRWDLTKIDWQCACIDSAITTITWANFLSCVLPWPLYFSRCMCTMHIIWLVCMSTCTLPVQCSVCMSG